MLEDLYDRAQSVAKDRSAERKRLLVTLNDASEQEDQQFLLQQLASIQARPQGAHGAVAAPDAAVNRMQSSTVGQSPSDSLELLQAYA